MGSVDRNSSGPQANRITSRTGGDRRTQMRLQPVRRVRASDLPVERFIGGYMRGRCANCAAEVMVLITSATVRQRVEARAWNCKACWNADNACANCHLPIITGRGTTNVKGHKVHRGGCPRKRPI